ncbi:hypothetical protein ALC53_00229 [Atta colombica]|uniref:Uncharacterized protein n=1 Tax=Atta colombica TaxID=520822 RepID=A0A195BXH4_9HYME|nr:hypothetical protein ALC53_00229 [Atta colombica]
MLTDSEVVIANECIKMLQLFEEIITSEISAYKVTSKYLSSIALEYLSVVGTLVSLERMFSRKLSQLLFLSSLDISD